MATHLQKRALEKVVEYGRAGKRINKGKILREIGYSGTTAIAPTKVFESKGFLELCDEIGLTDDFLTKALYEDIKTKKGKREKELRLGFQIKGKLKGEGEGGVTNNVYINNLRVEQQRRLASEILDATEASSGQTD